MNSSVAPSKCSANVSSSQDATASRPVVSLTAAKSLSRLDTIFSRASAASFASRSFSRFTTSSCSCRCFSSASSGSRIRLASASTARPYANASAFSSFRFASTLSRNLRTSFLASFTTFNAPLSAGSVTVSPPYSACSFATASSCARNTFFGTSAISNCSSGLSAIALSKPGPSVGTVPAPPSSLARFMNQTLAFTQWATPRRSTRLRLRISTHTRDSSYT